MAKLTLTDISSGYLSTTTFNANNTLIEAALENTLSRDGTSPNTMSANLDMNSNKIVNLTDPTGNQDAATKAYVDGVTGGIDTLAELSDVTSAAYTSGFVLVADGAAYVGRALLEADISDLGTYIANVVEDTTPQLGGDLDVNGNSIVSASNGDINITPDGTGNVTLGNFTFDADATVGAGQDNYVLTYDHSTTSIALEAAPAGGSTNFADLADINVTVAEVNFLDVSLKEVTNGQLLTGDGGTGLQWRAIAESDISDLGTYLTDVVSDTTPQLGGALDANGNAINMGDNAINRPVLTDYGLTSNSLTVSANAVSVDLTTGNAFEVDLEAATGTVTITLSNPPASGTYGECIIKVKQDSTADREITWAGGTFAWPGGSAPTMSTGSDAIDIYTFKTWDAGTTWYGNVAQDFS